jgi:16S rRNA (guanine527-N7)-methyltransferase
MQMLEDVQDTFTQGLQQLGLDAHNSIMLERLFLYRQELLDWNTRINLTAITGPGEILLKHFLDSLSLLMACDGTGLRVLDIGSGAGFPGLPLAIVRPQWHITLLEATGKRVKFLQHIIDTLKLENVVAIQGRAEELAHNREYRASFNMVTARAVASLSTLLEYCAPYCRVGGSIILPKKGDLTEELAQGKQAAGIVGASFKSNIPIALPGLQDGRRLLVWKQRQLCPEQFPRHGSAIAKKPLFSLSTQRVENTPRRR